MAEGGSSNGGRLRVAGLQLSPVWLNKKATVEKVTNSRKMI